MKEWFNNLCGKYLKNSYFHKEELHPFKKISYVSIDDNVLSGRISHDRYSSNYVEIKFKKFTESEKDKLKSLVDDNLVNTFKVINNTVPDDLLNAGISVLPESLDELEIECEQTDKNMNKIDVLTILKEFNRRLLKNNFLIFKIKGLDLKRNNIEYPVKTTEDIFTNNFKAANNNTALTNLFKANVALLKDMKYPTHSFDFIYTELFDILNNELDLIYTNPTRVFISFENQSTNTPQKSEKEAFFDKWEVNEDFSLNIDEDYNLSQNGRIRDSQSLFAFLNELNQIDYVSFNFLKEILDLTYQLVSYNAIMPEIFVSKNNIARIRWIPSFYDENVLNLCRTYYGNCPTDLITFNNASLTKENQVIILISLIMEGLLKHCFNNDDIKIESRKISNIIINLLTANPLPLKNNNTNKTIKNINRKLSPFYLNEMDSTYAMFISEDLEIEIKIKRSNQHFNLSDANEDELKYLKVIYDLFTQFKIENKIYDKIHLTDKEFVIFCEKIKPILKFVNVEIHAPFEIVKSNLELVMDIEIGEDEFSLRNLNKIKWIVRLKDGEITLNEFDKSTNRDSELLKTGNKYYILKWREFNQLKFVAWSLIHNSDPNSILKLALLKEYFNVKFTLTNRLNKMIKPATVYEVPESLNSTLRPYQNIGFSWLVQNIKSGFGSILADDMGLGKTLQVLTTLLYFKQVNFIKDETTLIIVPPTLISNWEHEIKKFTPDLTYYIYHGSNRKFPEEHHDIILTSYGVVRQDLEDFADKTWFLCVIDEAQNIKNPSTQQTKAIKSMDAFNKIALTGTPIENRLSDYWSIFDFTNPCYLSTLKDFKEEYITPIVKYDDRKTLDKLKTIAKPFVLRRLKTDEDIIRELPEKEVNDIYTSLTKKQIKLYNEILDGVFDEIDRQKGIKRKAMILKTITRLKQTCNHPDQLLNSDNPKIKESGKMELLSDITGNILDADEKVLIFTQYVKMGEIIQKLLSKKFKQEVLFLHGSQTRNEKTKTIDKFQKDKDFKILVATLKTGGTGLNLTAAQNVIHYDLWWNPAVENQATDRVHRIGQKNNVMVYRFITQGTLEEGIDEMIKAKLDLAEKTISTDETFITELTTEELKKILSLRL